MHSSCSKINIFVGLSRYFYQGEWLIFPDSKKNRNINEGLVGFRHQLSAQTSVQALETFFVCAPR